MNYTDLLPFMDKEELKSIALKVVNGELPGVKLERLFPFLGRENLHEIVDQLIVTKNSKSISAALPFLGKEKVKDIYEKALNGDLPDFDIQRCLPFIGSDKIKELFEALAKKAADEPNDDDDDDDEDEDAQHPLGQVRFKSSITR